MTPLETVRASFIEFTEPLEGGVPWLYTDIIGLVTTAYGNLVDPIAYALSLDFRKPDGSRASQQEIRDEWNRVKADPKCAKQGHLYAKNITKLRLTKDAMADVALRKFDANTAALRKRFPDFDTWPACAILAIHSLAWACGPAFKFGTLERCVKERDFVGAANSIQMNETLPNGQKNLGIIPRNRANKLLMLNASRVEAYKLDPLLLDWRTDLDVMALTKPDDAPEAAADGCVYAKE